MKRTAWGVTCGAMLAAAAAVAQVGPTGPSTAPSTKPMPATIRVQTPEGVITPADRPVDVPYRLSVTNHLIVRLKINGHGPYNFVVDTGAPTMLLAETVAADIGLKPDVVPADAASRPTTGPTTRRRRRRATTQAAATTRPAAGSERAWATIDRLDIEGGLSMDRVKCLILTPYQLTGMNSMGAAGVELHGLLGYSVLARFKMEIDLSKNHMVWTPQVDFTPPPLSAARASGKPTAADESREANLESMGTVMKVLGPIVKMNMPPPPKPRGYLGVELADAGADVRAARVSPGSPAEKAGVKAGDEVLAVNGRRVHSAADVQREAADVLPGNTVALTVAHAASSPQAVDGGGFVFAPTAGPVVEIKIVAGEGL